MLLEKQGPTRQNKQYLTFNSTSLVEAHRGQNNAKDGRGGLPPKTKKLPRVTQLPQPRHSARRWQRESLRHRRNHAMLTTVCSALGSLRLFVLAAVALAVLGCVMTVVAFGADLTVDQYLVIGAAVSCAFSLFVVLCYASSHTVRAHPNPLIFSKSLIDCALGLLYIIQFMTTDTGRSISSQSTGLAAATQSLLVCSEFWFFAIPIDLVQSITNPFTSYSYNFRVYWFYSVLSGVACGILSYLMDDCDTATCQRRERFFWFHHNVDSPDFFQDRWAIFHGWLLLYLVFAVACIAYIYHRLRQGLEETIDVRRHVLTHGLFTCVVYILWSLLGTLLLVLTNWPIVKTSLSQDQFGTLVAISAFVHAARGVSNILVWTVVNWPHIMICISGGSRKHGYRSVSYSSEGSLESPRSFGRDEEQELVRRPELNTALRKQMIQMATTGIIDSIQHFHTQRRRIESNHTFTMEWARSSQIQLQKMSSSPSLASRSGPDTPSSKVRVIEGRGTKSTPRFGFLPGGLKEMQFYDFQPRVFSSLRQLFSVNDSEYMYAFRYTMNERISEGRSGAFVFNTCDRKYLVKSMSAEEKTALLELLPSYFRYLKWNPQTLLPRFFGFHAMKMYGQIFYFVVMNNILSSTDTVHRRYDLKGSWVDRNAPACVPGNKYRCSNCNRFFVFGSNHAKDDVPCESTGEEHVPDITLRDNDLKKRIKLGPDASTRLLKQLTRDSDFLASVGIMDYSLLVGMHYSQFTIVNGGEDAAPQSGKLPKDWNGPASQEPPSLSDPCYHAHQVSGPSRYYIGIIDILQKWTLGKQGEHVYKVHVLRKDPRGLSAIPPKRYASRFQRKMKQLFVKTPLLKQDSLVGLEEDAADDATGDCS